MKTFLISLLACCALCLPSRADVTAGLVGSWKGEGGGFDSVGSNHGVLSGGPAFVPGVLGQSFLFDGVDDDSKMSASASLDVGLGNGFSLSAWVNPAQLATPQPIMEWNDSAGNFGVHLYMSSGVGGASGDVFASVVSGLNIPHFVQSPSGIATVNEWQHVTLTYDKPSGVAVLYRNGVVVAQQNLGSFTPQTGYALFFGHRISTPNPGEPPLHFSGGLDEMRLYNRALTPAEAATLYASGSTPPSGNAWDLRENWSDAANPNGVWKYIEGANALPHIASFDPGGFGAVQPAWARSAGLPATNYIPAWLRLTANFNAELLAGDVVVHTTDDVNGIRNGAANVTWTSPFTGAITISGGVWMGRDIGRGNAWTLYKNGVALTGGAISSGDTYNRASPFTYALGSGGASAVTGLNVVPGDVLKLELVRTTTLGDFVGVNLSIAPTTQGFENLAWQQWSTGAGHNDHAYALYCPPGGLTWDEAAAVAAQLGGTLATITSAEENAFVAAVANDAACWTQAGAQSFGPWLGGFQPVGSAEPGGGWSWITGEPFTYTNWHAGEPNNSGGNENRLHFYTDTALTGARWNDANAATRQRGAIIELPSVPGTTPGGWATVLSDLWTYFDDTPPYTAGTWGTVNTWPGDGADVLVRHGITLWNREYNHDHDSMTPPILPWPANFVRVHDFNMAPGASLNLIDDMQLYANGTSAWSNTSASMGVSGGGDFWNEGILTMTGTNTLDRASYKNAGQTNVQGRLLLNGGGGGTYLENLGPTAGHPAVADFIFPGDGAEIGGSNGHFYNYGRIRKTGGAGVSRIQLNDFHNHKDAGIPNSGRIEVLSGTLANDSDASAAATGLDLQVFSGAAYELGQPAGSPYGARHYLSGTFTATGTGKFRVKPAATLFVGYNAPATLNAAPGIMEIAGGRLDARGANAVTNTGGITFTGASSFRGGAMTNNGTVTIATGLTLVNGTDLKNGSAAVRSGILEFAGVSSAFGGPYEGGGGTISISNFAHLRKSGSGTALVQVLFANDAGHASASAGRIEVQSGTLAFERMFYGSGARIDLAAGALMELRPYNGGGGSVFHDLSGTIAVTGAGKLRILPGLELRTGHSGVTTLAAAPGTFEFAGGTLLVNGANAVTNTGTLDFNTPTLCYGGQLINQGTLHLAASAGANPDTNFTVTHNGAPTLTASGRVSIDVNARPNAPTQRGRYGTTAALTLGGTLQINFGNFTPVSGDRWKVVRFPSRTGAFSSVQFANIPAGFVPVVSHLADAVEIGLDTAPPAFTYAIWAAAKPFANAADALPGADPDGDGIKNVLECALGLDPLARSMSGIITSIVQQGGGRYLQMTVQRPGGAYRATDIVWFGEKSTTLATWTDPNVIMEIGLLDMNGFETVTIRSTIPMSTEPSAFLRARVEN